MHIRKGQAAQLMQINTGRMHIPPTERQGPGGRENFPPRVVEGKEVIRARSNRFVNT